MASPQLTHVSIPFSTDSILRYPAAAAKVSPELPADTRYDLEFGASGELLGVRDASPAPGAALWQLPAEDARARDFSFEDAGHGFCYIRSHVSNLYLTVDVPDHPAAAAAGWASAAAAVLPPGVICDVRSATAAAARQQWSLIPVGRIPGQFLIRNRATPGLVLRPANSMMPSPVVLSVIPSGVRPATAAWQVSRGS
jgi:hypothetical protein